MPKVGNYGKAPWNRSMPRVPEAAALLPPLLRQLIRLRVREGMTQAELAKRLGISPTTVQQYESCTRQMPFSYVARMAKILGTRLKLEQEPDNG